MSGQRGLCVALIGATGAVGSEILEVLGERRLPVTDLLAFASPESLGGEIEFRGEPERLQEIDAERIAACDLVICAGLFDYLPAHDAAGLLKLLYESLAPQGRMLVFNFSTDNSSRAYMEWIGNWYLIYREPGELLELAQAAGIPDDAVTVDAEPLGVNLVLQADKQ